MFVRITWTRQLVGPALCCAALVAGCSRGDDNAQANAAEAPTQATVSLSGCVEAAPGHRRFVLRNVRFEPRQSGDPHIDTTTAGAHGITEGAWVRLLAGEQDLGNLSGRRVTILGAITDNGQNTIGTAGTGGAVLPSGDRSQAASSEHHSKKVQKEAGRIARESMADGTAAEVRVQKVAATGDKCPLEVKP